MTWMVCVLGVSAGLFFLQTVWGVWAMRSVTKRLVASAQAHGAAERMHMETVANLNRVLEAECPKCVLLGASLQAMRAREGMARS